MIQMEQENNQLAFDPDFPRAILGGGIFFLKTHITRIYNFFVIQ